FFRSAFVKTVEECPFSVEFLANAVEESAFPVEESPIPMKHRAISAWNSVRLVSNPVFLHSNWVFLNSKSEFLRRILKNSEENHDCGKVWKKAGKKRSFPSYPAPPRRKKVCTNCEFLRSIWYEPRFFLRAAYCKPCGKKTAFHAHLKSPTLLHKIMARS